MGVQLRIVHQWHEMRKAIQEQEKKNQLKPEVAQIIHSRQEARTTRASFLPQSLPEVDQISVLFLKDTSRNTRRNFYLSKKRREESSQRDQEFFSKVDGRKEQSLRSRILYSNVPLIEKSKTTSKTPTKKYSIKIPAANDYFNISKMKYEQRSSVDSRSSSRKNNILDQPNQRTSITKQLKLRLMIKDDCKLSFQNLNYESIQRLLKMPTPLTNQSLQ